MEHVTSHRLEHDILTDLDSYQQIIFFLQNLKKKILSIWTIAENLYISATRDLL